MLAERMCSNHTPHTDARGAVAQTQPFSGARAGERGRSATLTHVIATSLALLFVTAATAATPEARVTGTYSSLAYNDESGDLGGTEITILFGAGAHYALVQCAEGEPGIPLLLKAQVTGLKVSFTVPKGSSSGCPEATYTGTVTSAGLTGHFAGFGPSELLKRKSSYWQ